VSDQGGACYDGAARVCTCTRSCYKNGPLRRLAWFRRGGGIVEEGYWAVPRSGYLWPRRKECNLARFIVVRATGTASGEWPLVWSTKQGGLQTVPDNLRWRTALPHGFVHAIICAQFNTLLVAVLHACARGFGLHDTGATTPCSSMWSDQHGVRRLSYHALTKTGLIAGVPPVVVVSCAGRTHDGYGPGAAALPCNRHGCSVGCAGCRWAQRSGCVSARVTVVRHIGVSVRRKRVWIRGQWTVTCTLREAT